MKINIFIFLIMIISCKYTFYITIDDSYLSIEQITPSTTQEVIGNIMEDASAKNKSIDIFLEKFEAEEIKK